MIEIFLIIAPVFIIIACGYLAAATKYLDPELSGSINSLSMKFTVPVLLFRALYNLDFSQAFHLPMLVSFYSGAVASFVVGILIARVLWKRNPGVAVAIGFSGVFSNSVFLGLPIVERAFGAEALTLGYGIVALHAPCIYAIGIITMELARRDGRPLSETLLLTIKSILSNPLMIGILLGALCNQLGIKFPEPVIAAIDMIATAALPVAVFGIGAALTRYTIKSEIFESLVISGLTLIFYPAFVLFMSHYVFELPQSQVKVAVTIASMPAGLNVYIFASMYNRAMALSASVLLISTILSIASISFWLRVLEYL